MSDVNTTINKNDDTEVFLRSRITELEDINRGNSVRSDDEIRKLKNELTKLTNEHHKAKEELEKFDVKGSHYKTLKKQNDQLNESVIDLEKQKNELLLEIE